MLFIMRAPSCSGKDSFIEKHHFEESAVISSDRFREMLLGDIASQQHNDLVFDMLFKVIEIRFLNKVQYTVLNATNLRFKDCSRYVDLCKKYRVNYTFLAIQPPSLEELNERNVNRGKKGGLVVPEKTLARHHHRYTACEEPFLQEALYSDLCQYIEIDQEHKVIRHVV